MARSKRRGKKIKSKEEDRGVSYEEPDPDSEDFYHDDVDKFYANREKIMLDDAGGDGEVSDEDSEDADEVMGLDIGESDEDDDMNDSEDEEGEVDSEDNTADKGLPDAKAWGKKKSTYYATDDVGPDVGSDEELLQLAEEEEEEALALQKQMAATLDDQDFDTADFEVGMKDENEDTTTAFDDTQDKKEKEKIIKDLTKLSKEEKLEILIKDSPELLELLEEFKEKLTDLVDKLQLLVQMARAGTIPADGANYVEVKHQLFLNYCINIGFYLLLKARQTPVRHHPVIGRLVQYRALIKDLEPLDRKLAPQLQLLLEQRSAPAVNGVQGSERAKKVKEIVKKRKKPAKQLPGLLDDVRKTSGSSERETKREQKRKLNSGSAADLMDPLEYYESVKMNKKRKKEAKERLMAAPDELEVPEEETADGKRQISYEIFKNKGLTARKKKELRNPRVKHRKKFHKATVKRKSQVRAVVNEQSRYGGEATGIRRNLSRSVKIK